MSENLTNKSVLRDEVLSEFNLKPCPDVAILRIKKKIEETFQQISDSDTLQQNLEVILNSIDSSWVILPDFYQSATANLIFTLKALQYPITIVSHDQRQMLRELFDATTELVDIDPHILWVMIHRRTDFLKFVDRGFNVKDECKKVYENRDQIKQAVKKEEKMKTKEVKGLQK